jgi:hypothetical protein
METLFIFIGADFSIMGKFTVFPEYDQISFQRKCQTLSFPHDHPSLSMDGQDMILRISDAIPRIRAIVPHTGSPELFAHR